MASLMYRGNINEGNKDSFKPITSLTHDKTKAIVNSSSIKPFLQNKLSAGIKF